MAARGYEFYLRVQSCHQRTAALRHKIRNTEIQVINENVDQQRRQ